MQGLSNGISQVLLFKRQETEPRLAVKSEAEKHQKDPTKKHVHKATRLCVLTQ